MLHFAVLLLGTEGHSGGGGNGRVVIHNRHPFWFWRFSFRNFSKWVHLIEVVAFYHYRYFYRVVRGMGLFQKCHSTISRLAEIL